MISGLVDRCQVLLSWSFFKNDSDHEASTLILTGCTVPTFLQSQELLLPLLLSLRVSFASLLAEKEGKNYCPTSATSMIINNIFPSSSSFDELTNGKSSCLIYQQNFPFSSFTQFTRSARADWYQQHLWYPKQQESEGTECVEPEFATEGEINPSTWKEGVGVQNLVLSGKDSG